MISIYCIDENGRPCVIKREVPIVEHHSNLSEAVDVLMTGEILRCKIAKDYERLSKA
jgi:hypothetical protein